LLPRLFGAPETRLRRRNDQGEGQRQRTVQRHVWEDKVPVVKNGAQGVQSDPGRPEGTRAAGADYELASDEYGGGQEFDCRVMQADRASAVEAFPPVKTHPKTGIL